MRACVLSKVVEEAFQKGERKRKEYKTQHLRALVGMGVFFDRGRIAELNACSGCCAHQGIALLLIQSWTAVIHFYISIA